MVRIKIYTLLFGLCFTIQIAFSQSSLNLKQIQKIELDKTDYIGGLPVKYEISQDTVYYIVKMAGKITLYKKHVNDSISEVHQTVHSIPRLSFNTGFEIDIVNSKIYYLFSDGVIALPNRPKSVDFPSLDYLTNLDVIYYDISMQSNLLVMNSCYNYATKDPDPAYCHYKVIDLEGNSVKTAKLKHDAIGFTHLPSYFINTGFNLVALTNALSNKIEIYDITNDSSIITGNLNLINNEIDSLPFNTKIGPYTNAKGVLMNVSDFGKSIDRFEGCFVLNRETIGVVLKTKGNNINSKRLLYIYSKDEYGNWGHTKTFKYKNNLYSKKYGLFQFYYPSGIKVIDENKISIVEFNIPNYVNSKLGLLRFKRNMSMDEPLKQAIYVYEIIY